MDHSHALIQYYDRCRRMVYGIIADVLNQNPEMPQIQFT